MSGHKIPARCEGCHQIKWLDADAASTLKVAAQRAWELWTCDECNGEPRIFTLDEFEREHRS